MPQLTRTFSNPTGTVEATGLDQLEEVRRGRQSSDALAREALAAQMAESAANRQATQQIQGTFSDRAGLQDRMLQSQLNAAREQQQLANQGGLDIARVNVGPNQTYADIARDKFYLERGDTEASRRLANAYANAELGLVEGIAGSMKPQGGIGGIFQNAQQAAGIPGGERAMPQDQAIQNLLRLKNPQAYFDSQRRAEDRAEARDTADTQAFTTMATSTDPRVRALGIAGLQKTRAFGQLPAGTVQGLGKPLVSTGAEFTAKPEVQQEIAAIGQQLAAAGNDTQAEALASALKPRVDRLVALAAEQGADPNQVLQDILGQLAKAAPGSSLYTNPLTTVGRAIPGIGQYVPEPSRDVARRAIGIQ